MDLALNDNIEALKAFSVLPYFKSLINETTEEEGWTAILAASAQPSDIEHKCIKFLVEHGGDIMKKKKDGNSVLHLASINN